MSRINQVAGLGLDHVVFHYNDAHIISVFAIPVHFTVYDIAPGIEEVFDQIL
jgi:hypothetical protein